MRATHEEKQCPELCGCVGFQCLQLVKLQQIHYTCSECNEFHDLRPSQKKRGLMQTHEDADVQSEQEVMSKTSTQLLESRANFRHAARRWPLY